MFQLLLLAILITLVVIGLAQFKQANRENNRKVLWRIGTIAFLALMMILVLSGRMHWVGGILAALLPFARGTFGLLSQWLPLWLKHRQTRTVHPSPPASAAMTPREAREILGFNAESELTVDLIHTAHRHLIQRLHPDSGGNHYLAAKINQARDYLINELKRKPA